MLAIPVLRKQRQEDVGEFKANLANLLSPRPARATQRDPVLKGQKGRKEVERNGRKEEGKEEKKRKK